jgi:hypothetical protein
MNSTKSIAEQWSVDSFLTELLDLHKSGWDGIGYMMSGEKSPERLFLVVGSAFAQRSALRAGLGAMDVEEYGMAAVVSQIFNERQQ